MDQLVQIVFPGRLQAAFDVELQQSQEEQLVERFWAKDASIWPAKDSQRAQIQSNLAWLDFPDTLEPLFRELSNASDSALHDGLSDWVFLALGSSSLAARALLPLVLLPPHLRFFLLDSSHPSAISRLQNSVDIPHTGFILANKSGDKLEDQALFLYFQRLLQLSHATDVNRHFAAQTEPNSFLSALSRGYAFRASFFDPPHVLSSYCSLIHFGALLVALSQVDAKDALTSARAMRQLCSTHSPLNPALQLAAFLSTTALAPCSYLIFLSSPSLVPYSSRLGHLIAGSLTHEGSKLIPITGQVPSLTDGFQKNAAFVFLTLNGERAPALSEKMGAFRIAGVPFIHIEVPGAAELLPETFKWEIATALACASLGLNPFDWPDVRHPRKIAMELLDQLPSTPHAFARTPRLQESGIQLFAEARTRSQISSLNLVESFRSFFRLNETQRFLVLLVFLDRTPDVESALYEIRCQLTRQLGIPILLIFGPRCFDQYAYLCLTGASEASFILLTADYPIDFSIPGADYTFSQLHSALCLGEFESIVHSDRFAIRINLTGDLAESLARLEQAFAKALSPLH